ncbi:MAG: crossover junction endodeoxyribonuclease RuvC [Rickettsiales bacterium]|nr:crossover junction endodeoxyribonuclease RuvC [Rickettsiales bacterium]
MSEIRILGIDPGLVNTGWGIISCAHTSAKLVDCGVIQTKSTNPMTERLAKIHRELGAILEKYEPKAAAIEDTFVNKNPASALKLGMARGVAFACPGLFNIPCFEYAPNQIKKSVVGAGHAAKEQIQHMVQVILGTHQPLNEHSADALAVAITHQHHISLEKMIHSI